MKHLTGPIAGLAGLWALAVAHPILDALGRAPEFFVAHRADNIDAILVAAALTLSGAFVCAAMLAAASALGQRAVAIAAAGLVGVLTAVLAVQVAYRAGVVRWPATIAVLIGVAALAALAWSRLRWFRTYLGVLSPAALVVPLVFLLGRPWPSDAAGAGGRAAGSTRPVPVVLMVFDELSLVSLLDDAGGLNAVRFPNLAALSADGVWFRNATAVAEVTQTALPAILTGRYPMPGTVPTVTDHPDTVFSLLGGHYRFEAVEAATSLCPVRLCSDTSPPRRERQAAIAADLVVVAGHTFLPPAARWSLPDLTQNWARFGADDEDDEEEAADDKPAARRARLTRRWQARWRDANRQNHLAAFEAFADGITSDDRQPTLYFIHTLATHQPARWLPSGQLVADRVGIPGQTNGRWTGVDWIVAQHHHTDLMQAMLADTLVGDVRRRLVEAGLYDEALVIVTADHGISFLPGGYPRVFGRENAAEILSVPLIVKAPAGLTDFPRGAVDDTNVETIDILPTIAEVLGVEPPRRVEGRSLLGRSTPRDEKLVFANGRFQNYGPDELTPTRNQLAKRQAELFGLDRWPVFGLPGLLSLAGRSIESFGTIGTTGDVRVLFARPQALANVDPDARSLPAQLTGRLESSAGDVERHVLAVALNGTIVGTTRVWPGTDRWTIMLPPDALRAGRNDVEVFIVEPSGPLVRPRP